MFMRGMVLMSVFGLAVAMNAGCSGSAAKSGVGGSGGVSGGGGGTSAAGGAGSGGRTTGATIDLCAGTARADPSRA